MLLITLFLGCAFLAGTVAAKSMYLVTHHNQNFQAYNINPDGTTTLQGTYPLQYIWAPAGVAVHEPTGTLFISSECGSLEWVDNNLNPVNHISVIQFAGVAVDDVNDILYAVQRCSNQLYAYDFDRTNLTLTLKSGFPIPVGGTGVGIALDQKSGRLWLSDTNNWKIVAYDTTTWMENTSLTITSGVHNPVGIGIDRVRGIVYSGSMSYGAGTCGQATGSTMLTKFDLATRTETSQSINNGNSQVVDVSVDEKTGLVYVSETSHMSVWDTTTSPWNLIQRTPLNDAGCGICVTNVSYMPDLTISKVDDVADDECVGVGGTITYTIDYENTGEVDLTGVKIVDDLPLEVDVPPGTPGYNSVAHTVTWDIGDVAIEDSGSESLTVNVNVSAVPGSPITNSATINSAETNYPTTVDEDTDICLNQPPDCSEAAASSDCLWPPNHKFVDINIMGVTDPDGDPITITIMAITSDEPTATDLGSGGPKHAPDASGIGTDTAMVRAERSGNGDGRVYNIQFIASDGSGGECEGRVIVKVPHDQSPKDCPAVDSGQKYDATAIN